MQTEPQNQTIAASVKPLRTISSIWVVPIAAILIGLWIMYYQWSSQGPLITIKLSSAEGVIAGKTKVKTRHVDIGEVEKIELNESSNGTIASVRISKAAAKLLVQDTQFWVVSPKINHTGISGLNTLISGVYIEMSPGSSENDADQFIALSDPPVTPKGTPGLHLTLSSGEQFAYAKGDPIVYKGLTVGRFEDIFFDFDKRIVYYKAFVKAPYHRLVTRNTKFWDMSGIRVDLTADGLKAQTGNIETLLTNGVTFDLPEGMPPGHQITKRQFFEIYPNYQSASDQRYKQSIEYIILVSESVRGLNVGAPVEYRGIVIGHVLDSEYLLTNLLPNSKDIFLNDIKIPVLISIQPARIGLADNQLGIKRLDEQVKQWIASKGLKATLLTGNLLTGSLFIDLQHHDDIQTIEIKEYEGYSVIPTMTSELSQITAKASQFMDNLNKLKLAKISQQSEVFLTEITKTAKEFQGSHQLIEKLNRIPLKELSNNSNLLIKQLTKTVSNFQAVAEKIELLLNQSNQHGLAEQLKHTLKSVEKTSNDFAAGSRNYEQLYKILSSLTNVMHELNPLLNQLKNRPNALIFNSGSNPQVEPKKYSGDN